jgi:hypothetical protein
MSRALTAIAIGGLTALAVPALAHHSFAMRLSSLT